MASVSRPAPLGGQFPPPGTGRMFVPLFKCRSKHPTVFLVCNPFVLGFLTHFLDNRIHPCTATLGACLPCKQGWKPRFRGFTGGQHSQTGGRYMLQITEEAWNQEPELAAKNGQLTGTYWAISRAGNSPQSRMIWARFSAAPGVPRCKPVDVLGVLSKLWGLDLVELQHREGFTGDCRDLMQPYGRLDRRGRR